MSKITDGFKALYGEQAGARTRAFIVDDEPLISKSAGRMLRNSDAGIATTVDFSDPRKAVEELTRYSVRDSVAFILSDCNMPGMTGIDFAGRLRVDIGETKIPFLLMSGNITDTFRKAVAQDIWAGRVDAFLEKPFEPEQLIAAVEKAIERRIVLLGEDDAE